ncbi:MULTISPECIES: hypothetical protein [Gordonia]|uniref:hypothetical protein n=1 Tax=Gordonia TaxID=2053 RepID=UPI00257D01FA|nr:MULTISPECIES: hypothetical protein [Gordonia]
MSTTTPGGRRWSVVLLVVATVGGVATTMTWVRAQGSVIPSSTDLTDRAVTRSGAPVELAARGVVGLAGAVALVAACLLAALALWAVSPGYRRARGGYAAIGGSAVGIAAVEWFLTDAAAHSSVFGAAVDVQTDTVEVSAWPPVTLCCFVITCLVGVMLVPRADRDDRTPANDVPAEPCTPPPHPNSQSMTLRA